MSFRFCFVPWIKLRSNFYHIYADPCSVWINGHVHYFISSHFSFTDAIRCHMDVVSSMHRLHDLRLSDVNEQIDVITLITFREF